MNAIQLLDSSDSEVEELEERDELDSDDERPPPVALAAAPVAGAPIVAAAPVAVAAAPVAAAPVEAGPVAAAAPVDVEAAPLAAFDVEAALCLPQDSAANRKHLSDLRFAMAVTSWHARGTRKQRQGGAEADMPMADRSLRDAHEAGVSLVSVAVFAWQRTAEQVRSAILAVGEDGDVYRNACVRAAVKKLKRVFGADAEARTADEKRRADGLQSRIDGADGLESRIKELQRRAEDEKARADRAEGLQGQLNEEKRRADEQQRRADGLQTRIDEQQRRADEERRRADEQQRRAEDEKRRADGLQSLG
ncbi:hypothetical protein FA09DRAFT_326348, partial [Tilletiopsis washingtonensis]